MRVHTLPHIQSIKRDQLLYEIACLAAGGAIKAAQLAMAGEASSDHCWGFCSFNNIAIALAKLQSDRLIDSAFILDFDLHFGDGTHHIFTGTSMHYFQPQDQQQKNFMKETEETLKTEKGYSILAVSAGFDRHINDWGGQLTTGDYRTIGTLVKEAAQQNCSVRRFAVLEGGYNHSVLGKNVKAFLEGLE